MFEYFTDRAVQSVLLAQEESRRAGHRLVGSEQVLLGLIGEKSSAAATLLVAAGATLELARIKVTELIGQGAGSVPSDIPFTPKVKYLFEQALAEAQQNGQRYVTPEHILLAMTRDDDNAALQVLRSMDIDPDRLRVDLIRHLGEMAVPAPAGDRPNRNNNRGEDREDRRQTKGALASFGENLTQRAIEGKLDPVVGRAIEIERTVQILGRRTKNNPILIGEPGVGKTAIAEGLAQRIVNGDVPPNLRDKQVISLDLGRLVAGTQFRGAFEERLRDLVKEIKQLGNVILFIDEVHNLLGAGTMQGGLTAANLLKPALARGELQCLGATTLDEYRQHIERDGALERRFQPVKVGEPSVVEAIAILHGLRSTYEDFHRVTIIDEALKAAVELADRYISDRFLPDKAIDLIDEAGSRLRIRHGQSGQDAKYLLKQRLAQVIADKEAAVTEQNFDQASQLREQELALAAELANLAKTEIGGDRPLVQVSDIAEIVSTWTGVPVTEIDEAEADRLLHLEAKLHERLIGQEEAVRAVARSLRRSGSGLRDSQRPIASFVFLGPTGTGKTELAKALAEVMFGSEEAIVRVDMSEYMEPQSTSKLIGSPPGFIGYGDGGQLTEAIRRRPYSVILFDEIEKAHPDIFNLLLQVLDEGHLTDAQGRVVNFKNTLIIMTSNLGAAAIDKGGAGVGFEVTGNGEAATYERIRGRINDELKNFFRPEFLNRLDEVVVFRPLQPEELCRIAKLLVNQVAQRLREQDIHLTASDRFLAHVADLGYDPKYGARPLRRTITQVLEDVLAESMLAGRVRSGDQLLADLDDDQQVIVRAIDLPEQIGDQTGDTPAIETNGPRPTSIEPTLTSTYHSR